MRTSLIRMFGAALLLLAIAAPAASALTPPPPPVGAVPAATPHIPYCETEDGARWCVVLSTTYPQTIGVYGWIGRGQPCGPSPLAGWFGSGQVVGICSMPPPQRIWRWTSTGWMNSDLPVGARVRVHPAPWRDWRWIHTVETGWAVIQADNLLLKWRTA